MKNSIFWRTFTVITSFTGIILLIFAGIVSTFMYEYSVGEKELLLKKDATQVSQYVSLLYFYPTVGLDKIVFSNIEKIAKYSDLSIILTNNQGQILMATDWDLLTTTRTFLTPDYMVKAQKGYFYEQKGTLGGLYKTKVYTVSVPIFTPRGELIGNSFVSAATPYTEGFLSEVSQIMINASIIVMLISLFVSYLVTNEIVRPLKTMHSAVREYAKGNFKVRIPITSEDEMGELALAFNDMAFNLERMEETRSTFVSNVSHDLKTPMTTIGGFVDGILDGTIPPEKEKYYLKTVSDEVRRLSRLIKGLLDVQRFETGNAKLNKTKFNLCEMAGTILISFEKPITDKNIYMEVHFEKDDMSVFADHDMIFQVVYNLTDNAVKFTNKDGIISITIAPEGKKVRFTIKNSGDGINSNDIKQIFDRFFKSDASRGLDSKGVGLGLYIVRSIIASHNETINVESEENSYCEFSFTLPMA